MATHEIKSNYIKALNPDTRVIEKTTIYRPFDFYTGTEYQTLEGAAKEFYTVLESNLHWTRHEGLVITRVKYFMEED